MQKVGKPAFVFILAVTFTLLLSLAASAATDQPAQDAIGEVIYLSGTVRAEQPDGAVRKLDLASPVFTLDVLTTSIKSNVEIRFNDETVYAQGAESTISLDEFVYSTETSASKLLFKMGEGTFRFVTGEIVKHNPDGFELATPMTTIGIRGTELFAVNQKAKETVGVTKIGKGHVVDVKSPMGITTIDKAGLSISVGAGGTMSPPAPTPPDVQKEVMRSAPMTSQGELGAGGDQKDLERKVEAFKAQLARSKGTLGGLGEKPNYSDLHTISTQKKGQKNAEGERDGSAGAQSQGGETSGTAESSGNEGHGPI